MGEFMKDFYSQSLLKTYRKKIYSKFLKALTRYNLLKENDSVLVNYINIQKYLLV